MYRGLEQLAKSLPATLACRRAPAEHLQNLHNCENTSGLGGKRHTDEVVDVLFTLRLRITGRPSKFVARTTHEVVDVLGPAPVKTAGSARV